MQQQDVLLFLYKEFKPMVRWMVITKGGNIEDANDIFQDTLIILLKLLRKPGFKQSCKMKTLIFAIANVQWKYKSRPRRREIPYHLLDHDCADEPPFPSADEIGIYEKVIWSTFSQMPNTCQKVLLLHWREYSNSEIAKKLACTEAYIRKRKSSCLQRFVAAFRNHKDFDQLSNTAKVINLEFREP